MGKFICWCIGFGLGFMFGAALNFVNYPVGFIAVIGLAIVAGFIINGFLKEGEIDFEKWKNEK